jgi:hypothetical protein
MIGHMLTRSLLSCALAGALLFGLLARAEAAGPRVVLGAHGLVRYGAGWGSPHPSKISNGGDASGLAYQLHWRTWGGTSAIADGLNPIFKPGGGYYQKPGRIQLRATDKGRCSRGGPLAYRQLYARVSSRPGGPLGKWFRWGGQQNICKRSVS